METETDRDWTKVVETETLTRLSLFSASSPCDLTDDREMILVTKPPKEARRKEFKRKKGELSLDILVPETSTHLHHHIKK